MKRYIIFSFTLLILAAGLLPTPISTTSSPLPGSVGESIEQDPSFAFPNQESADYNPEDPVATENEFFKAKIRTIVQEREDVGYAGNGMVFIQELEATILNGSQKNTSITLINEIPLEERSMKRLVEGNVVILGKNIIAGEVQYYISDIYRLNALWYVFFIFVVVTLLLTKFQRIRAFLGLGLSFFVIGWFIVPYILDGYSPILVSLVGTALIASVSLYIAHGFHARTTIALISTVITITLALGLSYFFIKLTRLFGIGSEEAFYLQFAPGASINLQGLLLGGIIIGILGILDDITTAQTAAVEQIYYANTSLSARELYERGSVIGREHILALVNTLVLAYTGASLPLILLFKVYERPAWVTLNSEIVMEEVVRMIIGSLALVIAVPITTFLAARYYSTRKPNNPPHELHVHHH